MSTKDEMNIDERYKYLRVLKKRYNKANRKEKAHLLDEMETNVIKLTNGFVGHREPSA